MSELRNVIVEKSEEIARIILNRPEVLNAINKEMLDQLKLAVYQCGNDRGIRAIIISGVGRAFCSGIDLNYAQILVKSTLDVTTYLRKMERLLADLEKMDKPTIAAVNGYAIGEGCEIALACDFRIASENARLGMTYIQLGLVATPAGTWRLIELVGLSKAKELILLGDSVEAEEALRLGLVNRVVATQDLEDSALELAVRLVKGAPLAIGVAKREINASIEANLRTAADFDIRTQAECLRSEDTREGIAARIQKRKPVFKGR